MVDLHSLESLATEAYMNVVELSSRKNASPYFQSISREYHQGLWKVYYELLRLTGDSIEGKSVVDFGCKYGHLLPLLILLGARKAIGIEVEPEYIALGKGFFEKASSDKIQILTCEYGFIPIPSESIDVVFMNEAISHINPGHLDTVLQEISRILKAGGILFISDGNNVANEKCRRKLLDLWDKWENGPDGVETDRGTVTQCYLNRRKEMISYRYPDLDKERVHLLALNTSGLWGDLLLHTVDEFVNTGHLIQRTYRRGDCPTNPSHTGVVMERGFHPMQIVMSLKNYGIEAHPMPPKVFSEGKSFKVKIKALCLMVANRLIPGWYKERMESFKILGIKKS